LSSPWRGEWRVSLVGVGRAPWRDLAASTERCLDGIEPGADLGELQTELTSGRSAQATARRLDQR
jgi:hypothetical protein